MGLFIMKYNDFTPEIVKNKHFYETNTVGYLLKQYKGNIEDILSNENLEYYAYNFTDLLYGISIWLYNIGMTIVYCSTDKQYLLDNADDIYNDFIEALNAETQSESDRMLEEILKKYNVVEFDSETQSNLLTMEDILMLDDTLENTLINYKDHRESLNEYDIGDEIVDVFIGNEYTGEKYVITTVKDYKVRY